MTRAPLIIANHMGPEFGAFLRALPNLGPLTVIDCGDKEHPWDIPTQAEVLVTRALPAWRHAPANGPDLPALKWVQTYSAGIEIYPDWLKTGRILSCGRGLTAPQIAEYALAAMLRVEKRLDQIRATSPGQWVTQEMGSLEGKCLGLIGFGAIGSEVVRRARAFGMQIRVSRRGAWTDVPEGVITADSVAEVVAHADHLVLAAPLTPATRSMINAEVLDLARPGLHLINVARGGLVVQPDLIAALDAGKVDFATLDVTDPEPLPQDDPLWSHPKVLLTPHISYLGGAEDVRFRAKVAANLASYVAGQPLLDVVDLTRGY